MKEFVVGAPYTTETTLDQSDEFLIVACDGVRLFLIQTNGADETSCGTYVKINKL
jgi:hypothetical protein